MDEVTARAAVVPSAGWETGLAATVDRSQIESALAAADSEPELLLDVTRTQPDADGGETRRIAIGWDRNELEQILAAEKGDRVTFAIDGRSLAVAFDQPDVEAHGLREKAAVLTVAIVTAAAGAAAAQGSVMVETSGSAGSAGLAGSYTTMESNRSELIAGNQEAASLGASYTAMEDSRSELAARGAEDSALLGDAYTAAETSRAELASQPSTPDTSGTLGDAYTAAETSRAQLAGQSGTGAAEDMLADGYTAAETARSQLIGTADDTGAAVSADDGISLSAPDPTALGVGAGLAAFAIAGAAFVARSRRRDQPGLT